MTIRIQAAILIILLSLCNFFQVSGQGDLVAGQIKKSLLQYTESFPREEIFVHCDREEFIAGEDLWFNLYLIDRQTSKPSASAGLAYFEILNHENRPVVQKRIRLDKGFGPGQVVLPDTLSSGVYTIRAYTSWMKNFLPQNCYTGEISIYNALNNSSFKVRKPGGNKLVPAAGPLSRSGASSIRVSMEVAYDSPDNLMVRVTSDESWRKENNNQCYLVIQTHGVIDYLRQERVIQQMTEIMVSRRVLPPGINQITLFNAKGLAVSERYVYTPAEDERPLSLVAAETFDQRSKVSVEISFPEGSSAMPDLSNMSISVAPVSGSTDQQLMSEYLVFGSEFGDLPRRFLKGRKMKDLGRESRDSLLSMLSSNWIDWRKLMSGINPEIIWKPETTGHYINGRLISSGGPEVEAGEYVTLSKPGKIATFQYGSSDSDGNFSLRVNIDEDLHDMVIQPEVSMKNRKVMLRPSFTDRYPDSEIFIDSLRRPLPAHISDWSVNYQVSRIYESSVVGDPLRALMSSPPPVRFYGKPDQELIMDDYIRLPVMEEVFFELILGAWLKKRRDVYEISVSNPVDGRIYEMSPVLMVDGVIIDDASIIGNMDPDNVERIHLVRERYFVGDYIFYGIINVITRKGDFDGFPLSPDAIRVPYRVLEPVWSFASPDYSSSSAESSRIPDFRNTLYWNPMLKPGSDGKARVQFWTSDIKTDYVITLHGLTSEGKAVSVRKTITVK